MNTKQIFAIILCFLTSNIIVGALRGQQTKRVFVGFSMPSYVQFGNVQRFLKKSFSNKPGCTFKPEGRLHMTLVFIGTINSNQIYSVKQALRKAASNYVNNLGRKSIQNLTVQHRGTLLGGDKIAVLVNTPKPLQKLVSNIKVELNKEKIKFDRKPFLPHVTLGSIEECSKRNIIQPVLNKIAPPRGARAHKGESFGFNKFHLFETIGRGRYKIIASFDI